MERALAQVGCPLPQQACRSLFPVPLPPCEGRVTAVTFPDLSHDPPPAPQPSVRHRVSVTQPAGVGAVGGLPWGTVAALRPALEDSRLPSWAGTGARQPRGLVQQGLRSWALAWCRCRWGGPQGWLLVCGVMRR